MQMIRFNLLVVMLLGAGSGEPERAADSPDAIAALEKMHVRLERDKDDHVVQARLPSRSARLDEATPHLKRLPRLAWVACNADDLTIAGLRQLATVRSLTEFEVHANGPCQPVPWQALKTVSTLRLSGHGIDDAVLKAVAAMPAVTSVHLNDVKVTAPGLAHLQQIGRLDSVLIQKSNVSAEGVRSLAGITKLRMLTLAGNSIGAAGFAHLATLGQLDYLNLELTGCTDADVAALSGLTDLTHLDLGYNRALTDAALRHLTGLRKLGGLRLYETKVTDAGVAELKKALPRLSVGR
jgi:hypothetical protein